MPFEKRVLLAGSERVIAPGSEELGPVNADQILQVTVIFGHKGRDAAHSAVELSPSQMGADPSAIAEFERFAYQGGLTIVESSVNKRRVVVAGTVEALSKAFETQLAHYDTRSAGQKGNFRCRHGGLTIPSELAGEVLAVLGLDNRPVAKPHFRISRAPHAPAGKSFTPPQVAALYNFPKDATGQGQTVGIIELGGGYSASDLQAYFSELKITAPSVTAVSVDGGTNSPGAQADAEVMLDIEVVGAIAPGAHIAVYFAPNTDQGFIDAVTDAVHDTTRKPSVVSISWGGPEDSWTQQAQTAMNAALQDAASLGVTVTSAAGDGGSSDGAGDSKLHVDFPASSPYALACGGTKLSGSGSKISSEVVWNETAAQEGATGGRGQYRFRAPGLSEFRQSADPASY